MSSLPDITVALGWKPGPVDKELDENILSAKTCYYDGLTCGAPGDRGRSMMHGTFESEKAMYSFAPKNVPEPVAWGTYKSQPDTHFYICGFHEMLDDLPDIRSLGALVARIHTDSMGKSPNGKYGFPVATHLANIPNDNSWCDTWEKWFTNAMRRMLQAEKESHGPDLELEKLTTALFEKHGGQPISVPGEHLDTGLADPT
ncbi:MAG: hypothetical protein Q9187_003216 [Circinaria calcarea]